jgi:hypothetical protein
MTEADRKAHREHMAWLDDCGRWRAEHRQTLAMLAKVQATIMEQEAGLETHAAQISAHDMHLQKYSLTAYEPGAPDYEFLDEEHARYADRHERAREAHERLKKHHVSILEEVKKLLGLCEAAM